MIYKVTYYTIDYVLEQSEFGYYKPSKIYFKKMDMKSSSKLYNCKYSMKILCGWPCVQEIAD